MCGLRLCVCVCVCVCRDWRRIKRCKHDWYVVHFTFTFIFLLLLFFTFLVVCCCCLLACTQVCFCFCFCLLFVQSAAGDLSNWDATSIVNMNSRYVCFLFLFILLLIFLLFRFDFCFLHKTSWVQFKEQLPFSMLKRAILWRLEILVMRLWCGYDSTCLSSDIVNALFDFRSETSWSPSNEWHGSICPHNCAQPIIICLPFISPRANTPAVVCAGAGSQAAATKEDGDVQSNTSS